MTATTHTRDRNRNRIRIRNHTRNCNPPSSECPSRPLCALQYAFTARARPPLIINAPARLAHALPSPSGAPSGVCPRPRATTTTTTATPTTATTAPPTTTRPPTTAPPTTQETAPPATAEPPPPPDNDSDVESVVDEEQPVEEEAAADAYDAQGITFTTVANLLVSGDGTEGAQAGIALSLMAVAGPGDEVILSDPGYFHVPSAVIATGAVPVTVPIDAANGFRLDPDVVAAAMALIDSAPTPAGLSPLSTRAS